MAEDRERGQEKRWAQQVWVPFLTDNVPSPFPLAVKEKASFCLVCTGLGERREELNSQLQDQDDGPVGKVLV